MRYRDRTRSRVRHYPIGPAERNGKYRGRQIGPRPGRFHDRLANCHRCPDRQRHRGAGRRLSAQGRARHRARPGGRRRDLRRRSDRKAFRRRCRSTQGSGADLRRRPRAPATTQGARRAGKHECVQRDVLPARKKCRGGSRRLVRQHRWPRAIPSATTLMSHQYSTTCGQGGRGGNRSRHRRGRDARCTAAHARVPTTPFFRFPCFALDPSRCSTCLQSRGMAVFGADVWASDWEPSRRNRN